MDVDTSGDTILNFGDSYFPFETLCAEHSPQYIFKPGYKTVSAKRYPCSLVRTKLFDLFIILQFNSTSRNIGYCNYRYDNAGECL